MITAIVLYDLPPSIGLEECREHFTKIAPDFLKAKGFLRKGQATRRDETTRCDVISRRGRIRKGDRRYMRPAADQGCDALCLFD